MAKWKVTGSAEKFDHYSTSNYGGSIKVEASALTVIVDATSAGYAHDKALEGLDAAGWRNIRLTGVNQEG